MAVEQKTLNVGLRQLWTDVRQNRHRFRQAVGGAFAVCVIALAHPVLLGVIIGGILCALGAFMRTWAAGYVFKNHVLETRGPYAFVRHPQYLGNFLLALGFCLAADLPLAVLVWAALFVLFYTPAIQHEDDKLNKRFGDAWTEWARGRPAIIPLRWPRAGWSAHLFEWSVRQWARNGEPIWMSLLTIGFLTIVFRLP